MLGGCRCYWLLLLVTWWPSLAVLGCPSACKCMWKGGKQTVECINEGLITIPDGIDQGTQVLEFSGNNLQTLPRERFQRMGLLNLQRIYLSRCRIVQIDDRAFKGLTNLVELDLSQNFLRTVPSETFSDYTSLMRLTMNGNPITALDAGAFKPLSSLTNLELSNCEIEYIDPDAFTGLTNIEWLKLDGNQLASIRGAKTLPESLNGIYLQHNPWQCDCKLTDLRTWLVTYNVPQTLEPKCTTPPRLKEEPIKSLDQNDLACLPDVSPTTLYLEIAEGKNVSLLCRVSAIPEARVSWWFQGRILQNDSIVAPGLHLYYFVEEGSEEKKSELFIFNTNTEDNGTFVCVAENPAGKSHSNYTIRIIVREEPIVGTPPFPYEYVITIACSISVIVLFIIVGVIVCIIKCRRRRMRRRKKERSKVVALQQGKTVSVNPLTRISSENLLGPPPSKANGTIVMSSSHQREVMMILSTGNGDPCVAGSPHSMRSYTLEQNPDLINDTESVGKDRRPAPAVSGVTRRIDGDGGEDDCVEHENSGHNSYQEAMENIIHEGSVIRRDPFQHQLTADVHLSAGRFLDNDGYPMDFGLPKLPPSAYYRTLPHSRSVGAATPTARFSREAEFLARTSQPYDHYSPPDVRYTLEGYPCKAPPTILYGTPETPGSFPDSTYLPSPPAAYKGEPTTPAKGDVPAVPWVPYVQCCVGSQTNGDASKEASEPGPTAAPGVFTESPDEGYVGDGVDGGDI